MCTKNPNDFWAKIRNLGPKNKKVIPLEIVDETGMIINDEEVVQSKWRTDFKNLYNGSDSDDFDQGHFEQARANKHSLESRMDNPTYLPNETLNRNILLDKINLCLQS